MRALGIDFGTVRIGVAISDENMKIASALKTIEYNKNDYQYVINQLKLIVNTNAAEIIVLGYPVLKDGTKTKISTLVEEFYEMLKTAFPDLTVILFDEAYSTKETVTMLKEFADLKSSQIKKIKDKLAAQKILQAYIESSK